MIQYTFRAGVELVEIRATPIEDLDIRINNRMLKTGANFVPISKLVGDEKAQELKEKLRQVFDDYIETEFNKMGYALVRKDDI